jgi:type IV secretion system protein VirD4
MLGFGPTRSGKDAGVLVPLVKTYPGSVIVHDPAFQIAAVTARYRSKFSQVFFVNPFGTLTNLPEELKPLIADLTSHGFNIMASGPMNPEDDNFLVFYDDLARAATELTENKFWYNSAVNLRTAFFMFQRMVMKEHATMSGVRRMMSGYAVNPKTGKEEHVGIDRIIAAMMKTGYDPIMSKIADFVNNDETRANIFKHVASEMACFDFGQIRKDELGKSYNFEITKHRPITIYFGIPTQISGCEVWKRLILGSILRDLMTPTPPGEIDPIVVLNEAYQFGPQECVPNFLAGGAKHGARLVSAWQDPSQINKQYGPLAGIVRGSRGALWSLAPNDPDHAQYIRILLGKETDQVRTYATHSIEIAALSEQAQVFNLMNDDDLIHMRQEEMVGLIQPCPHPLKIEATHYYKVPWLRDGLDVDPYHDERFRRFLHDQERIEREYTRMVNEPTPIMRMEATRIARLQREDDEFELRANGHGELAALPAPEDARRLN